MRSIWDKIHKRLNRSRCRLGWWVGLTRETVCYVRWRSPKGKMQFLGNMCLTSLIPLIIANWTGLCSGTIEGQTLDWLQALDESIIGREVGMKWHTAGEVWYIRLPSWICNCKALIVHISRTVELSWTKITTTVSTGTFYFRWQKKNLKMQFECLPFSPTMENEKLTYVKGLELPPIEW